MKQKNFTTRDLTQMALCTAILVVSGFIRFPLPMTPVPVSAQTLAVNLVALIMTPQKAFLTLAVYLLIGLIGIPVFGGSGGIGAFAGPNGGFIIGFLFAAFLVSFLFRHFKALIPNQLLRGVIASVLGSMPIIYALGTIGMCLSMQTDVRSALLSAVVPFIFGDTLKCVGASVLAAALSKALSRSQLAS